MNRSVLYRTTCLSANDQHPGALPVQDMYESPRQQENAAMMTALDGLKRVFEPQEGLLASLRGLGLDMINGSGVMKRQIMKYAMGVA